MRYGHAPGDIDDYAWQDVALFLELLPLLDPLSFGGDT